MLLKEKLSHTSFFECRFVASQRSNVVLSSGGWLGKDPFINSTVIAIKRNYLAVRLQCDKLLARINLSWGKREPSSMEASKLPAQI